MHLPNSLNLFTLRQMMFHKVILQIRQVRIIKLRKNITQDANMPLDLVLIPTLRGSNKSHVPNIKYLNYLLLTNGDELEYYDEACQVEDSNKQELVMKDEMKSLISNRLGQLSYQQIRKLFITSECVKLSNSMMALRDIRLDWWSKDFSRKKELTTQASSFQL